MPNHASVAPHEPTSSERRLRHRASVAVVALVIVMIATQLAGFLYTRGQQEALTALRTDTREMRISQQALVDAESSISNYLATGEASYFQDYFAALETLEAHRNSSLRALDQVATTGRGSQALPSKAVDQLIEAWDAAIEARRDSASGALAQHRLFSGSARTLLADVRGAMGRYIDARNVQGTTYEERIAFGNRVVLSFQLIGGALTLLGLIFAFRLSAIEARGRQAAVSAATRARTQIEQLFQMADTLQSASGYADANAVLRATAETLIPDYGGALYIFNNSRDRLDLSASWNQADDSRVPAMIAPHQCWALKRGKQHINNDDVGALCCDHVIAQLPTLEIPMMARGEVHGLLQIHSLAGETEVARLREVQSLASAIADGMSLALSNLALREKLRNQALRDPLTGLYNRRYMEDMFERLTLLGERNGSPVAVVMIDLDHFKRLNDEHGHAMGDAVLRDAAATLAGGLRQSDVACRYGGEELILLLPDCTLDDAVHKAEMLRARIEALSETHGARVTASFGVSCVPETTQIASDLIPQADAALYRAKSEGRNRVAAAPRRSDRPGPALVRAAE